MVVNTAGVVFVCNAQPREWYKAGGLVADLFWTLAVNSFFVPLVQLVDLPYLLRSAVRHRRLSQDKLDSINERLAKVGASPEDRRERLQAAKELEAALYPGGLYRGPKTGLRARSLTIDSECWEPPMWGQLRRVGFARRRPEVRSKARPESRA